MPPAWFEQVMGPREAVGLDDRVWYKGVPLEETIAEMDEAGVQKGLLHCQDMGRWGFRIPPEAVVQAVEKYPDRLVAGAVGVNPHKGMEAVREFERCVKQYGFKALHLHPGWIDRPANDAIYYPLYAKCVELDVPVVIQLRQPLQSFLRSYGRPEYIEDIAVEFLELQIVGLHLGWPWLDEFMGLLTKRVNFYMTTSAYPTAEWEPKFSRFVNALGQDKIIFGSSTPKTGGIKVDLAGIEAQQLDEKVKTKALRDNAIKVFKL